MKKEHGNNANLNMSQLADELNCTHTTAWMLVAQKGAFPGAFRLTSKPQSPWRIPRLAVLEYITRRGSEALGG